MFITEKATASLQLKYSEANRTKCLKLREQSLNLVILFTAQERENHIRQTDVQP